MALRWLPASVRAVALLGWLATHPGSRPRSEIAPSLWADVPDCSARNSVCSALSPRLPQRLGRITEQRQLVVVGGHVSPFLGHVSPPL